MKILQRMCVVLLAAFPCCAQGRPGFNGLPQQQQQYGGSISGHVYCADTNAPARFARVILTAAATTNGGGRGGSGMQTVTGLDGSFVIQNVRPGSYYVTATLPGYINPLTQVASADLSSTDSASQQRVAQVISPITITGSETVHQEIKLEHGGAISGTVYYDDGSPAVNLMVSARAPDAKNVEARATGFFGDNSLTPRTDEYGRYRIAGLAPNEYVVAASSVFTDPGMFAYSSERALTNTLVVYSPKTVRLPEAKLYKLRAGSEINGADIIIPVSALHTVSGTVESADGRPLTGGTLTLTDIHDSSRVFHTSPSMQHDGSYHFLYVPDGEYTLALQKGGISQQSNGQFVIENFSDTSQTISVQNGDLTGVSITAKPTGTTSTVQALRPVR